MLFFKVFFGAVSDHFRARDALIWENALLHYQVGVLKRRKRRIALAYEEAIDLA
jgi:hypothetical protein